MTRGAVCKAVSALERAGLVERVPDPDDRRHRRVGATAEGARLAHQVRRARCTSLARWRRLLMPDDVVALTQASRSGDWLADRLPVRYGRW